jgi:steroid 5-alpha reductase family enzyme
MMNLVRRSFRRRSMNMEMMKMAVWSPRLSMYLLRRPLSHTYDDKPRSRRSCC